MSEAAIGSPSEPRDDALRIESATIDDLPALTGLVMELFAASGDFNPDQSIQQRRVPEFLPQVRLRLLEHDSDADADRGVAPMVAEVGRLRADKSPQHKSPPPHQTARPQPEFSLRR